MKSFTLGEVAEWGSGGTPRRGTAEYFGPGVPWLSISDLNDGPVAGAKESLTPDGIANSSAKVVPAGTLFVAMYGSIGKLGLATKQMATSQAIAFAKPNRALVETRYLFHYLLAQRPRLQAKGRGGTQMNISQGDLRSWPIPLPSLDEQRRVAAILDHADALRAKRRQVLTHLDALTQSVFHDMFGVPMTPGRWPMRKLGDVARIVRGASPRPAGDPRYFGGHTPWLKISDITSEPAAVVRRIKEGVTDAGRERSVLLPEGTLVLTNSATVGIPKIIEPATCIHDGFLAFLELDDDVDQFWLWSALAVSRRQLVALAPEGTQKNLNGPIVKAVEVAIPPLDLQRSYSEKVACIEDFRHGVGHALTAGDELFASLQSRAFRGEL